MLELPLFPLHTTLFPRARLPLHIFEQRYHVLLKQCLSGDRCFGTALIKHGSEVGEPATPHSVGTIAHIATAQDLPDGRVSLVVEGRERFSIQETWVHPAGFLMGRVTLLPEISPGADASALLAEARRVVVAYVRRLSGGQQATDARWLERLDPLEATALLATILRGADAAKQAILAHNEVSERLRLITGLVRQELVLLDLLTRKPSVDLVRDILSPN